LNVWIPEKQDAPVRNEAIVPVFIGEVNVFFAKSKESGVQFEE
jgi:hypothetical protein